MRRAAGEVRLRKAESWKLLISRATALVLGTSSPCNLMSFREQSGFNGNIEAAELTNTTTAAAAAAAAAGFP
jgi:hypothetical protein